MDDTPLEDAATSSAPSAEASSSADAIDASIRQALAQLAQLSDLLQPVEAAAETMGNTDAGDERGMPPRSVTSPLQGTSPEFGDLLRRIPPETEGPSFFSLHANEMPEGTSRYMPQPERADIAHAIDRSDPRSPATSGIEPLGKSGSQAKGERRKLVDRQQAARPTGIQPEIAKAWAALDRSRGEGAGDAIEPGQMASGSTEQSETETRRRPDEPVPRVPSLEGAQAKEPESEASGGKSVKEQLADLRAEQQLLQRAVERLKRAPARFS